MTNVSSLADRVRASDARAIARAISLVEDGAPASSALIAALHASGGRAYLIGVTGPPGAGKSTLVDRMTRELRAAGRRVGVIAVDPSSPFTGGAVLGDRVRMQGHANDEGVFIRSMATRGHLGGLARATGDAAAVLDAAGFDPVIIETVGVGQGEVDVVRTADVSIVVAVPGAGDEVQAIKAGIMEIADVFVVNKRDYPGVERTVAAIESLRASAPDGSREAPIVKTQATSGEGVSELLEAVTRFRAASDVNTEQRRRARAEFQLREALAARWRDEVQGAIADEDLAALTASIAARQIDPYSAASRIVERVFEKSSR
jgi:LAO/AO transport system kinase